MKVLIAIPCLLTGGTEIQTLNLVRALIQGGHQVTTACYFEHTENMVKLYEDAGSKVVLFSKEGVRLGGVKGILFLLKIYGRLNYLLDLMLYMYSIWHLVPFPSSC